MESPGRRVFRSILVDVDALAPQHPALERALELAVRCRAKVKVVDAFPNVPRAARGFVTPGLEEELVADRHRHLVSLACWRQRPVPVETALLRGAPAVALIQEVLRGGHDLLVRSHGRDLPAQSPPFGPVDLQLLRKCPCPVWLVGPGDRRPPERILAAVDVSSGDRAERTLNQAIIDIGLLMRGHAGVTLTVLHAWAAYGDYLLEPRMTAPVFAEFIENARRMASEGVETLVKGFGDRLADARVELVKGDAPNVIPEVARTLGIDLIVMGTIGRSGIAGLLMGNTAERVLQRWQGSVLAVKPADFVSPVLMLDDAAARLP